MSDRHYHVVGFGAYRVGVEVIANYPHHDWLVGWLRDEVAKRKGAGGADHEAMWLSERVKGSFPDRGYFVEVQRSDRLGQARVEGHTPASAQIKQ